MSRLAKSVVSTVIVGLEGGLIRGVNIARTAAVNAFKCKVLFITWVLLKSFLMSPVYLESCCV